MQVKEIGSGAAQREARERPLEVARRREIDAVLVWRLGRWGRSVADLLVTLEELEHLGVGFVSLTGALDLTTSAGRATAGLPHRRWLRLDPRPGNRKFEPDWLADDSQLRGT